MLNKIEIVKPNEIEKRSFEIITEELEGKTFPEYEDLVVKRVIHTTADFDYVDNLCFSEDSAKIAIEALRNGASIITDTNMAASGINKKRLEALGGTVNCFMAHEDVAKEAEKRQVTRAAVSMERGSQLKGKIIFAIGNAPTALIRLYELINEGIVKPELIIGVPVGFVNVVESKELIMSTEIPYIVSKGRKGGSTVAAAICNALIYQADKIR
ncbi:precorrin-8X methylmutase [Clostridium cellulovorans]|uniref:Precorrin-8X methylmutase n=1 Tax=Clostridium cellulovorans (strain ATCC 35296 / DSM 3052 / OCM 3 / 743B) TaxID=573061 RepID=D9SNY8_CLOC7|nr:precorrin-8X methylmutase [Clostridium cellulovorans]ADL51953.1 Precorrin-8X methylmutase [Clostridium cellulovorans 743B]